MSTDTHININTSSIALRHFSPTSALNKLLLLVVVALAWFAMPAWGSTVDDEINPQRRYDQVTFLTAHNAFASTQEGWLYAQQALSIPNQLQFGVRGLMLDIHMAQGGTVEKECKDVQKPVTSVEDQCKKTTRQDCKNVTKTKEVCHDVSKKVCEWAPWPANELCKTVTERVCTPTDYVENVCTNIDDVVCSPITVTKMVTENVCNVVNIIPSGPKRVRLCHEKDGDSNCGLTRSILYPLHVPQTLADALKQVKQFLDNNQKAVITIFFESYVDNKNEVDKEFAESGINGYLFDQKAWLANPANKKAWPTIQQMRNSNKRLVVFSGRGKDERPNNWEYVIESQYNLAKFPNCEIRGETAENVGNPAVTLMTMNHFYEFTPGQPYMPDNLFPVGLNSYPVIYDRVKKCQAATKLIPNFIALDFAERGAGTLQLIKFLNQVPR